MHTLENSVSSLSRRAALGGLLAVSAGLGFAVPGLALAQQQRGTRRLLVGFPPGGTADVLARLLAEKLTRAEDPLIVENKPGAGGRIGAAELKNGPADGRTLMVSAGDILTIYPHVFKKIAYDTLMDVTPVAPIASEPVGLVVGPMVPASVKTLADFIAWCRANPKDASYTTAAAGTTMHFLGSMLAKAANFEFLHVPHRGGQAAVQDVLGGQIASTMTSMSLAMPFQASGKLRTLAISSQMRNKRLPDVPTFIELGYKDLHGLIFYGGYLRSGTAADAIARWHGEVEQAVKRADVQTTLASLSLDPMLMPQPEFAAFVRAELQRWAPVIKASGYSADE